MRITGLTLLLITLLSNNISNYVVADTKTVPDMVLGVMDVTAQKKSKLLPPPPPMIEESGFSRGSVARATFTTDVIDRAPIDDLKVIPNDVGTIKFYTDLRDMSGHKVIHRWEYNGEIIVDVPYEIRGPRWRVWSSKNMSPKWLGKWRVSIINVSGDVIEEKEFEYIQK